MRVAVFGEGSLEAIFAFIATIFVKCMDEEEVVLACCKKLAAVSAHVDAVDSFAQSWDMGLRIHTEKVEQTDVAFAGGNRDVEGDLKQYVSRDDISNAATTEKGYVAVIVEESRVDTTEAQEAGSLRL